LVQALLDVFICREVTSRHHKNREVIGTAFRVVGVEVFKFYFDEIRGLLDVFLGWAEKETSAGSLILGEGESRGEIYSC
jgi:hypothetical protein